MTVFWDKIMDRFNATNLTLQKVEISLCESQKLYTSLIEFVGSVRNDFDAIESEAKALVNGADFRKTRTRQRKRHHDESVEGEVQLAQRDTFRTKTFLVICDKLQSELNASGQNIQHSWSDLTFFIDGMPCKTVNCSKQHRHFEMYTVRIWKILATNLCR